MTRTVRFIELELINFTSHRNLKLTYGDITRLLGMNGEGKSSIGIAPSWIFYGNDLFGNRFNPSPLNYEFDRVFASLILSIDGKEVKFAREINEKGSNQFYINDVPTKAKEYEAAVASLFDKEEFLSLYNPSFFFAQHWTKQREQLLKHTPDPAKSDVLREMSRTSPEQKLKDISLNPAAQKLDELTKKHSLVDLQKIHGGTGGRKSDLEKQHIAAQSRTKTLQEQLDRLNSESIDVEAITAEIDSLSVQIGAIEKVTEKANDTNANHTRVQSELNSIRQQILTAKNRYMEVYNAQIEDTCETCQQPLKEESIKTVTEAKEKLKEKLRNEHAELVAKRKELEEELTKIELIDVTEQFAKIRELDNQRVLLSEKIKVHEYRNRLTEEVAQAKQEEESTLAGLKESIFILDAIKAYKAAEAELQAVKVQSLFTKLTVRLHHVQGNGEIKPDFEIQMDGKNYSALSVGEKIAAGLELTEVLFKQSELIAPCFIDNIESYTGKIAVYGQLITGRAVPDQKLKIEMEVA